MKKQLVYLAGGFDSGWRESFRSHNNVETIDPKDNNFNQLNHYREYGCWDLHHVKACDICFTYMSASNPSGYGLSVEIGYAKGLGKTTILVLEKGHPKDKYLLFLTSAADIVFDNLEDGLNFLKTF